MNATTQIHTPTDRLLRLPDVMLLTGLARTSLYEAMQMPYSKGGGFPRPVKMHRKSAWPESEVREWIECRKADRPTATSAA